MVLVLQGVTIYAIEIQQTNKDLSYAFLDNDGQIWTMTHGPWVNSTKTTSNILV